MTDDELRRLYGIARFTSGNYAGMKCFNEIPQLLDRLAAMREVCEELRLENQRLRQRSQFGVG